MNLCIRNTRLYAALVALSVAAVAACGGEAERSAAAGVDRAAPPPSGSSTAIPPLEAAPGRVPALVLEACDTSAAVWMRRMRSPQLRLTGDSLFSEHHELAGRRGCVVVVDGRPDTTTGGHDDLRTGLPGARWFAHPSYDADGAGSTGFGIWRPGVLCVTHWEVPAGLDDGGQQFSEDTEHVEVSCAPAVPSDTPDSARVGEAREREG